jgi:quinol-cytochrome oxidoreductase complex cytochrome b subunit
MDNRTIERRSLWHYFGWLTLFLLLVMLVSGMLLTLYYEPSAAPAVGPDGRPLVAVIVTQDRSWNDHPYHRGDVLPLPYDPGSDSAVVPMALQGAVLTMRDSASGAAIRPSAAWTSLEQWIMREVEFGWLIRSIHSYSANLLMAALFIHMFSAMLMRAYRRPRELMWVSGSVLLLLLLGFGFTGYLLPWNRLAYAATRVGVGYPEHGIPLIGPGIAELIRAGRDVGGGTLTRMFSLHTVFLPMGALVLAGLHLWLLNRLGLSGADRRSDRGGIAVAAALGIGALALLIGYPLVAGGFDPVSPYAVLPLTVLPVAVGYLLVAMAMAGGAAGTEGTKGTRGKGAEDGDREGLAALEPKPERFGGAIYRDLLVWTLMVGIILTLAIVAPWSWSGQSGLPVDLAASVATPAGAHPEWYLLFAYQLLNSLPGSIAMLVLAGATLLWFCIPFIDQGTSGRGWLFRLLGIAMLLAFGWLTLRGYAVASGEQPAPPAATSGR